MTRKTKHVRLWAMENENKRKAIRQKYLEAKKAKEFLKELSDQETQ